MTARPAFVEAILAPLSPETRAITERLADKHLASRGTGFLEDEGAVRRVWEVCRDQALEDDIRSELAGPPAPPQEKSQTRSQAQSGAPKSGAPVAVVTCMNDVERLAVEWLWPLRIPRGMPTVVDGLPKVGKSVVMIDVAARVTKGSPMPDGSGAGAPRSVVILSTEDDPARVLRPRLEVAGADLTRVFFITMKTDEETRDPIIKNEDIAECVRVILEREVALLVLDPLVSYLRDSVDTHNDHSTRRALAPLKPIFEETDCAVVAIRHWKKATTDDARLRGGGSIGMIAAARAGLAVGADPNDKETRVLAVSAMNFAQIAPSLQFQIVGARLPDQKADEYDIAKVEWLGVSSLSADDLTSEPPPRREAPKLDAAKAFLRDRLAAGPVPAKTLLSEAKEHLISSDTLRRAKEALEVEIDKDAYQGPWVWRLPAIASRVGGDA